MIRSAIGLASRCLVKSNIQSLQVLAPTAFQRFRAVTHPLNVICRQFSAITRLQPSENKLCVWPALQQLAVNKPSVMAQQSRTVTKYSIQSGKRKTVKAVIKTFYRLNWGLWIHARAGRNKRIWRKSCRKLRSLQNHVFCTKNQCIKLDKMTSAFWKRPKYWVDDPYEPYHEREEFYMTRKKPLPAHNPSEN